MTGRKRWEKQRRAASSLRSKLDTSSPSPPALRQMGKGGMLLQKPLKSLLCLDG